MKVILRKNDSATSLLLFVYNIYLTYYNKDKIKLSSLLEIMKAFGKSESATRMSLSRTAKSGILINKNEGSEVIYTLDLSGKEAIKIWNEGIEQFWKRYALRNGLWDEKWYLVNLEFREEQKENRAIVVERLLQMGFGLVSPNTWICPYYQTDDIRKALAEFKITSGVIEMHGEIKIYDNILSFINNVFHAEKLAKSYKMFITQFSEKYENTKNLYQEEWFIKEGRALPLLHALGWEFLSIASEDAALPKTLCPAWAGDEAAQLMIEFRKILLEPTLKYLGKFD
ncbi:phenylacetic acid-responsive transcriptional repressor [Desulfosporosinus orientis DSM 765]|uniref:Phenylacetic acid-responsive transcriptional repressor n=1 Tax=Desulfosporosinus orientis (strain ATCC 19365 / DSM 765 / NCIMB 8382 / VKM B-1628 / Singapore I) TaxID=768706 RepID=G7W7S5_DESOD|nr:PaaX family transcriptional regulator C-terminal domain-containing protein [Desulfosporosinus orientis]AET66140.1 phenylacetic acid-responsive transcriptional repressor [Desulfosporosinus orientis DSM 765]